MFKMVLFDFDGVLADTWEIMLASVQRALDTRGRSVPHETFQMFRDEGVTALLKTLSIPSEELPDFVADVKRGLLLRKSDICVFPWVPSFMMSLKEHEKKIAIISSHPQENINHALGDSCSHFFRIIGDSAPFNKEGDIATVLDDASIEAVSTVYIGDEPRDFTSADAAGIMSIGVKWGYSAPELLGTVLPPDRIVSTPEELLEKLLLADAP